MYTLYYSPGACSMAVHVLLNSLGVPFQLAKTSLSEGENRKPDYLKLNPRGQVPVLVEDGQPIREGAAILMHLCEKHNSPLLPREGRARTEALEWLMFCNATLHPAYSRCYFLMRVLMDQTAKEPLYEAGVGSINKLWEEVEQRLSASPYLAGAELTVADILLAVIANWSGTMPKPVILGPRTKQHLAKITALPAYQKALATEGVEYKAAA